MPSRECVRLQRSLVRLVSRRRVVLAFVCCFFLWSTMFSFLWDGPAPSAPPDSGTGTGVGRARLDSARQFISHLASQQRRVVDGPYTGRLTGYDTKKLLAVLLDGLMSRLSSVERRAARKLNVSCADLDMDGCGSGAGDARNRSGRAKRVSAVDLLLGAQDSCRIEPADLVLFPQCEEKVKWMERFWRSHPCYRRLGVDGTHCSFVIYLSEVERFCPRLPSRASLQRNESTRLLRPRSDMAPLLNSILVAHPSHPSTLDFIRERVARLWPQWAVAAATAAAARRGAGQGRGPPRLRVHLHLGLLSRSLNWGFAEGSRSGGPLGELVQWSDLIGALFAMGHDLRVTTEMEQLASMTAVNPLLNSPCLVPSNGGLPDLVFADIAGLDQLRAKFGPGYARIKCILRVVDTFGTQPKFNMRQYARRTKSLVGWGGKEMQPRQFFTLYPLTPDNSFLGFVVDRPSPQAPRPSPPPPGRREIALIYGKMAYMWKGMRAYLDVVNEFFEIHATVTHADSFIPAYVINHRFVNPKDYQKLLHTVRVYVGLGFPFEGPAPLEAIAQGAVFINPRFQPPLTRANSDFFRQKPTEREITSQHPYIEKFIGEPHSYLVDMHDLDDVRRTLRRVLAAPRPAPGLVLHELTQHGMIERLAYYLRTQDFCAEGRRSHYGSALDWGWRPGRPALWPPARSVRYFLGLLGDSCERTCARQDRICEPGHFVRLNSVSALQELSGLVCDRVAYREDHLAPFRRTEAGSATVACIFQSEPILFSCSGAHPAVQRVCPCRDYVRGQSVFCLACNE